jgi:hypothetical protein
VTLRNITPAYRLKPSRVAGLWFWVAVAASLVLSLTPWGQIVLYPFRLFTTWVHECGHAVAALAVGGSVEAITIAADGSGLTRSRIPVGRLSEGVVASAGYLGASLVGCVLIASARVERWARPILWAAGICLLLTGLLWVRNLFGLVVVLAWAAGLLLMGERAGKNATRFVLGLLAVQVALNAVYDVRTLFLVDGPTDATAMAKLFLLPSWVWAGLWMLASVMMLAATLRLTWGRAGRRS